MNNALSAGDVLKSNSKKNLKKIVIVIETNYADFTLHHVFNDIFSIMSTIEIYRKKPHENEMLFVD